MSDSNISCPACGSNTSMAYMEGVTDLLHGVNGSWNLQKCTNCGLIYTTPLILEDLIGEYYPDDYAPYGEGDEASGTLIVRLLKLVAILPYTLKFGSPGYFPQPFGKERLLEVGCGAGRYLQKMSAAGWQCTGLDISARAIETARRLNPATRFVVGKLSEVDERFDLVVMHHVLEHLYHPKQEIETCFRLLQPGGRLVVTVPNIASLEASWFGRRWIGLDIPRHTIHFKETVLERLLVETGFAIERKRPGMFASSISESFIMGLPEKLRRKVIHSRVGRVFYLMLVPIASISYVLGNRGTVEIVAVKN